MAFKVMKTGAWANTGTVKVMKTGAWATAGFVKARKLGAWVQVWPLVGPLTAHSLAASGTTSATSTARYYVDSDGFIYTKLGTASIVQQEEQWLLGGTNSDYEVKFTQTGSVGSGSLNGTLGSWLSLSTDREINTTTTAGNTYDATVTVEIREASSGTVVASTSIDLTSDWF